MMFYIKKINKQLISISSGIEPDLVLLGRTLCILALIQNHSVLFSGLDGIRTHDPPIDSRVH